MKCPECGQEIPVKVSPLTLGKLFQGMTLICSPYMPDGYVAVGDKLFRIVAENVEDIDITAKGKNDQGGDTPRADG